MRGAMRVLPAPVRFFDDDEFELPELDLELEPQAASASDATTARRAVLVRSSFLFMH
jgi:hypothetical protein